MLMGFSIISTSKIGKNIADNRDQKNVIDLWVDG